MGSRTAMAVMSRELEPGREAHVERGRGRRGGRVEESGPFKTSRYADLLRMPQAGRGWGGSRLQGGSRQREGRGMDWGTVRGQTS